MRVLYVANNYPPDIIGGAELIAHRHARALNNSGVECCVFAGDHSGRRAPLSMIKDRFEGLTVFRVALSREQTSYHGANFKNPHIDDLFAGVVSEFRPHVVHFHNLPGLSVDMIDIARNAGCRTVLTVHDHWGFCHRQTLTTGNGAVCTDFSGCKSCLPHFIDLDGSAQPIEARNEYVREKIRTLDLLLSPSSYLARQYVAAGMAPQEVGVLGYGVDLRMFWPGHACSTSRGFVHFGVACYLGEHKGIRVILHAVSRLPPNSPVTVTFAGKGPLGREIGNFIETHPNGHLVAFVGEVAPDSMHAFYTSLDVFVSGSIWPENQPLTILEAMAAGTAVIATDCGGSPELVAHGRTGRIVERGNAEELSRAMLAYAKDPEEARRHGQAGMRTVSTQGLPHAVRRLCGIYHGLAPHSE